MEDLKADAAYRSEIRLRTVVTWFCFLLAGWWMAVVFWGWHGGEPLVWQEMIFPILLLAGGLLNLFRKRRMRHQPELAVAGALNDRAALYVTLLAIPVVIGASVFLTARSFDSETGVISGLAMAFAALVLAGWAISKRRIN